MRNADTYIIDEDFTLDVVEDEEEDEVNEDGETCMTSVELKPPKEERKLTGIAALIEDIKESVKKKIMKLPDVCPVPSCKYKSQNEEWFLRHLDYHIRIADVKESVKNGEVEFPEKCPLPFCRYKTQNKEWFLSHLDHHLDEKLGRQYKCSSCNFITSHKNVLSLHRAKCTYAHKLYCSYEGCNFVTIKQRGLRKHVDTQHLGIKDYICRLCRFKTRNRDEMQTHRNEVHPKVKESYMCKMCSFKSENRSELMLHQKRHVKVKKVKIFKCDSCDYESRFKGNVIKHHASKHKVALN